MLNAERLREVLYYAPDTGIFTRRIRQPKTRVGDVAGGTDTRGYIVINVDGRRYRAARLAWLYMTGSWPTHVVDHIDGNRANDQWANLRAATHNENMRNTKLRSDNTSGLKGAYWIARNKRWRSQIQVDRRLQHLGYFDTAEEAHAAYCRAAEALHGEFARTH